MESSARLGVLDGLRGVAVLLVLWYHIWQISWLPAPLSSLQFIPETGFIGVDLFFFLSGFVIVYPFLKAQQSDRPPPSWGHFYYRRAIKILPSYLLSIVVLIAVGYAHFASWSEALRDIMTHLLFIHTWWSDTYGAINGVLWTLAVEVEFYVVFPLLWWFFRRNPWITAAILVAVSLAFREYAQACCTHTSAPLMINNLPGYVDVFAFGMLSAYLYLRLQSAAELRHARHTATVLALGGIALAWFELQQLWQMRVLADWPTAWEVHHRSVIAAAFCLIAVGSLLGLAVWRRVLSSRLLLFFGAISYNLYLYHQAVARLLLQWHIPPYRGTNEHADPRWQIAYTFVAVIITTLQAAVITYAFERPLLRMPYERWRRLFSNAPALGN
jgi:peptidoglycan/LPS O-acetylase OafA/YrhL